MVPVKLSGTRNWDSASSRKVSHRKSGRHMFALVCIPLKVFESIHMIITLFTWRSLLGADVLSCSVDLRPFSILFGLARTSLLVQSSIRTSRYRSCTGHRNFLLSNRPNAKRYSTLNFLLKVGILGYTAVLQHISYMQMVRSLGRRNTIKLRSILHDEV